MKENGMVDNVEIMPDLENEQIESMPPPQKSGGCGCNKNKQRSVSNTEDKKSGYRWDRILLVVGGLAVLYFMFKKKGVKVEVPEV